MRLSITTLSIKAFDIVILDVPNNPTMPSIVTLSIMMVNVDMQSAVVPFEYKPTKQ